MSLPTKRVGFFDIPDTTPRRGELVPGVDCYIIGAKHDDHRVSKTGLVAALTPDAKRSNSDRFIERIPAQFLAEVGFGPSAPNLIEVTVNGVTAHTYSATDFVKILTAYSKWLASGTMRKDQEHLGRNAAGVLAGFASAGVIVSIRQACGVPIAPDAPPPQPVLDPTALATAFASAMSNVMTPLLATLTTRLDSIERRLDERPTPTTAPAPPATLPPIPATPPLPLKSGAAVRSKDPFEVKLAAVRAKVAKAPESFTVSVVRPGLLTPADVFEALAVMAAAGEIERERERQGRGRPAPRYRKLAPIAPTAAPPVTTATTVAPPSSEPPSSPMPPTPTPELANRLESLERKIDELRVASLPAVDPVAAAAAEEHRRNVSEKRREAGRLGAATTNAKRWGVPQTEEEAELKRHAISEARREAGRKGGLANAAKVAAERGARRGEGGRFAPATALHGVAPFDKAKANQVVAAIKEGFDRQEARELAGVSTEVFESWLTRGLSTDYTEDDFEYRLFYLQVTQAETKRAEKQRVLDEDRRRALGLIYQLRQPFYRADLGRALWPGGEWSAEQIDPIITWLEAEGMICPMPGRTRAGWSSTKWVVVDGAAASAA
ncbi:MAG TPA: hypothetical protein PK095_00900 [Myxococcota bacterium]|nr:hypothetical protein [Myxococcota bacterium]